jgi:hypothetical protein
MYSYVKYSTIQAMSGFDLSSTATAEEQSKYFVPIERSYTLQLSGTDFDSRDGMVYWAEGTQGQSSNNPPDQLRPWNMQRQSEIQERSKPTVRDTSYST